MDTRKLFSLCVCLLVLLSFLGLFAVPVHANGSVTRVQGNARGTSTGINITVTMASAPASGNSLIATIGTRGNGAAVSISSITQTGVTWSVCIDKTSGWQDLAIWLGVVGDGASASLNVTLSGNAANGGVADVCEYSGLSASPLDKNATASSAGPTILTGTTATTAQANELWVGTTFAEGGTPSYYQYRPINGFIMLDGGPYQQVSVAYLENFVTATGTANSGTTSDASTGLLGCIATFKLSAAQTGIVRVQGNARNTSTTSTVNVTMGATPTSGNVLISTISSSMSPSGPATVTSITESGVTWTYQVKNAYSSEWDAEIWLGVVGAGASTSVNITLSGTPNYGVVANVCEYSGIATTSFLDKNATNGASSAATTDTGTTATTTQASELWIGLITTNLRYQTFPTNAFGQFDGNEGSNVGSAYLEKIVSLNGTANSGTTPSSSAYYSGCIATFKAAAATRNHVQHFERIHSFHGCTNSGIIL